VRHVHNGVASERGRQVRPAPELVAWQVGHLCQKPERHQHRVMAQVFFHGDVGEKQPLLCHQQAAWRRLRTPRQQTHQSGHVLKRTA
jgi:hypothetical protein